MKLRFTFLTLLGAVMSFGMTAATYANHLEDYKAYAASECERWSESADPATRLWFSERYNQSATRTLRLDCPAIHDRLSNTVRSTYIRVVDRHPQDRVCARFVAVRHIGAAFLARQTPARCTPLAWNSSQPVQLWTGGLNGIISDMHYYFSVYRVPRTYFGRQSGVVSYYVNEVLGTAATD